MNDKEKEDFDLYRQRMNNQVAELLKENANLRADMKVELRRSKHLQERLDMAYKVSDGFSITNSIDRI